jgi:plasmid stability protein
LAVGRNVQVRDVPDAVHRTLKAHAAESGRSLSDYLRAELAMIAARPTPEEVRRRLRQRAPVKVPPSLMPERIIRRLRGPLP